LYLNTGMVALFKSQMADYYAETYQKIIESIVSGKLVHADETHANVKGKAAWVWVLTNMRQVAYRYSETREDDLIHELLITSKGYLSLTFMSSKTYLIVHSRNV
jgi:hypothetical protein